VERLEEERLDALTDRVDCELALGRHHELTSELESLVKQYPLRERLRAQLMLALYRSGRQAEALDAYQNARRTLVEELGLEPGRELHDLEHAILTHDPSLDLPVKPSRVKRRRVFTAVPVLGIAAVVALALSSLFGTGSSGLSAISPNAVGVIDPVANELVAEVPVGIRPGPVSVGKGSVWVLNLDDETVSRIDPKTRALVATLGTDGFPSEIASAGRSAWVILAAKSKLAKVAPGYRGRLQTRQVINPIAAAFARKRGRQTALPLGSLGCPQVGNIRFRAVIGGGDLWFVCGRDSLSSVPAYGQLGRLSLPDGAVTNVSAEGGGEYLPTAYADVAYARGLAWVVNWASNSVFDVDPRTNRALLTRAITVGKEPVAIAAGADSLWVANFADDTVSRIDMNTRTVTPIDVGDGPVDVAFGEGAAWVANSFDHTISRIDPETNEVTATVDVGREPLHVAAGEGAVWVTTAR
jgi:YVTN family beta-propeller protein